MDITFRIFRLFYLLKMRDNWYFFPAKSVSIVNHLLTSHKHWKEFIYIRSCVGFKVDLTWRVANGRANEVTR